MMTSSNGNIFRVTSHLCGNSTGHRWISHTKASDAELWCFFYLCPNERLSKQSWGWWFGTLSSPLWRHCNVLLSYACMPFCVVIIIMNESFFLQVSLTKCRITLSRVISIPHQKCNLSHITIVSAVVFQYESWFMIGLHYWRASSFVSLCSCL